MEGALPANAHRKTKLQAKRQTRVNALLQCALKMCAENIIIQNLCLCQPGIASEIIICFQCQYQFSKNRQSC